MMRGWCRMRRHKTPTALIGGYSMLPLGVGGPFQYMDYPSWPIAAGSPNGLGPDHICRTSE